ncbi:hypothetical protein BJY52DRAFT_1226245 [Lactarius psammicola]|nr:hypothetical protein BJY52DRAFT_1226245 [Lactarius psammicola]
MAAEWGWGAAREGKVRFFGPDDDLTRATGAQDAHELVFALTSGMIQSKLETSDGTVDWVRTSRGGQHLSSPTCGTARRNVKVWVGLVDAVSSFILRGVPSMLFLKNEGRDPDETRGEDSMMAYGPSKRLPRGLGTEVVYEPSTQSMRRIRGGKGMALVMWEEVALCSTLRVMTRVSRKALEWSIGNGRQEVANTPAILHARRPREMSKRGTAEAVSGRYCVFVHLERGSKYYLLFLKSETWGPNKTRREDSLRTQSLRKECLFAQGSNERG